MPWSSLATHAGILPSTGASRQPIDRPAIPSPVPRALPSLRQLLIRLLLIGQMPLLLMVGIWLATQHSDEEERQGAAVLLHAQALALALGEDARQVERQLQGLAAEAPAHSSGLAAFYEQAERVGRRAGVETIVFTMEGGERFAWRRAAGSLLLADAQDAGTSEAAEPPWARTANRKSAGTVRVAVPGPGPVRAMSASLDPAAARVALERRAFPVTWSAAVVEAGRTVVAHFGAGAPGLPADMRLLEPAFDEGSAVRRASTPTGKSMTTAYVPSPVQGWAVVVSRPANGIGVRWWIAAGAWLVLPLLVVALSLRLCARALASVDHLRLRAGGSADDPGPPPAFAEASQIDDMLRATAAREQRISTRLDCAEERLEAILQAASDAIVVVDAQHRLLLANHEAARCFGRSAEHMAGIELATLLGPDTFAGYLDRRSAAEAGAMGAEPRAWVTGWCRRADASSFPVAYSLSVFPGAWGRRFCALVLRDVSTEYENAELHRKDHDFQTALLREVESRQASLARELHDGVASSLTGASLLLARAHAGAAQTEAAALIAAAQEQVVRSMQQVRGLSHGIMPAGQDDGALVPALELFAADVERLPGIRCSVKWRGDFGDVSGDVRGHLFRVVQEATSNALRHGAAQRIRIVLARAGSRCRLTVADDGNGCDPRDLAGPAAGIGVRSMRARAEAIGGVFAVKTAPGRGLRVRITWATGSRDLH